MMVMMVNNVYINTVNKGKEGKCKSLLNYIFTQSLSKSLTRHLLKTGFDKPNRLKPFPFCLFLQMYIDNVYVYVNVCMYIIYNLSIHIKVMSNHSRITFS